MFNKIFKTLDKYPKIYSGFFIYAVINALFTNLGTYLGEIFERMLIYAGSWDSGLLKAFLSYPIIAIGNILTYIFLFPYLFRSIKIAASDIAINEGYLFYYKEEVESLFSQKCKSYKETIKSDWYKIILLYTSIPICILIFYFILPVGYSDIGLLIMGIYTIFIFIALILIQIASVIVIMEDDFKEAIRYAWEYGRKIIFPLIGVTIFINIPILILGYIQILFFESDINAYTFLKYKFEYFSFGENTFVILLLFIGFIYSVFANSFIYTYVAHKYIYLRCETTRELGLSIKFEGELNNSFLTGDGLPEEEI